MADQAQGGAVVVDGGAVAQPETGSAQADGGGDGEFDIGAALAEIDRLAGVDNTQDGGETAEEGGDVADGDAGQQQADPEQQVQQQPDKTQHYESELQRLRMENENTMGLVRELVNRIGGNQQQTQQAQVSPVDKFGKVLADKGLKFEKPETVEQTNRTMEAWFEARFGMSADDFTKQQAELRKTLDNVISSQASNADQSRTMAALAQMKATENFDALGSDKQYMQAVMEKYVKGMNADATYTKQANIPPDVLARLAKLEKMEADQKRQADQTQKAQAVKKTGKAAPTTAPNASASKGMAEGIQLTDAQLRQIPMNELMSRLMKSMG